MGLLKRHLNGDICTLEPEHLVGRSPRANLLLSASYVSSQHATIRWGGQHWELKDLGSRNGTLVNGERVGAGVACPLPAGIEICFGREEQKWALVDDSAPRPLIVSEDDPSRSIVVDGEVAAIPDRREPWATIMRWHDGSWKLEKEEELSTLASGQTFEVLGERWRFVCPAGILGTSTVDWPERTAKGLSAGQLLLKFSREEEHVELYLRQDGELTDLGTRSHNYLLLYLARKRLAEVDSGLDQASAGWVYRDDILKDLRIDREHLNLAIFRVRKQFEKAQVPDAACIIQRRPDSQQLRIGIADLKAERL